MISNACAYALRAMIYLATQAPKSFVAVDTVAREVHLPPAFLRKVMQKLVQAHLVVAMRGAGGGVCLAIDSRRVSVYDIILAIDGNKRFVQCMLHLKGCTVEKPCPFHAEWAVQRTSIQQQLQALSLYDITQTAAIFNQEL